MLLVAPLFTSYDVTECFDLQIYFKSTSTKECKCHYKTGQLFWIIKRGKVALQSSPVSIRRPLKVQWTSIWSPDFIQTSIGRPKDVRYPLGGQVLQSRVIFITNWDSDYKVVQYREQMKETGEINFGNLLFHSTLTCLVTDTYRD